MLLTARPNGWRVLVGVGVILLIPFLAWIGFGRAMRNGWLPSDSARLAFSGLSLVLILGVASPLLPLVRTWLMRRLSSVVLVVTSIVIALALAEIVAGQFRILPLEDLFHLRSPYYHKVFRPIPGVMPGIEGESHLRMNSLGIRGDALPGRGAYRILCVGGSTTECLYLDQVETWPHLLQDRLGESSSGQRTWVGNAGYSGFGTKHHLSFIQTSNLIPEMDCLVLLVGMNDFMRRLRGRSFVRGAINQGPHPALFDTSLGKLVLTFRQRRMAAAQNVEIETEDKVGASYVLRRQERERSPRIPLPDMDIALDMFRKRVVDLVGFCRESGVRCVFVSQPVFWKEDMTADEKAMLWMGFTNEEEFVDEVGLRRGIDSYNNALASTCHELGAEFVDLREMSGTRRYFYDDCHFNEAGAEEVARRIAEHFLQNGL